MSRVPLGRVVVVDDEPVSTDGYHADDTIDTIVADVPPALDRWEWPQSSAYLAECGHADGWVDAALGRSASAAARFVESRWHLESMAHFAAYFGAYMAGWKLGRGGHR